ncbi:TetR/AcrR family transcriptional regulator [Oleomonas cavernae]|uniref:TetR/AcrR family transcriptional regulator n=1 Tax=Oleomonas cavernae TaxID=2320859 RepID=A0A418W908_9PROT|nr:TetR/AcrR family transcriptional regulator [Oleomonas cavernae]RJF86500.1 TetR/AcrR family transcriptional regulator [Oleomonas cavernae]
MNSVPSTRQFNETQQRILDAAIDCVKQWGIDKTNLNDIAKQAGVTRPTVYRYFASRDEVLTAALLQSGFALAQRMLNQIDRYPEPGERFVEAVLFALGEFPNEPYLAVITRGDLTSYVSGDALNNAEGWALSLDLTRRILHDLVIPESDLEEITEVSVRMILSLLIMAGPRQRSVEEMRGFLTRRLLPMLGLEHYPRRGA